MFKVQVAKPLNQFKKKIVWTGLNFILFLCLNQQRVQQYYIIENIFVVENTVLTQENKFSCGVLSNEKRRL